MSRTAHSHSFAGTLGNKRIVKVHTKSSKSTVPGHKMPTKEHANKLIQIKKQIIDFMEMTVPSWKSALLACYMHIFGAINKGN